MSAYAFITGTIHAENEISACLGDHINKYVLWDCQIHKTEKDDWMFHGSIKECRLEDLWNALSEVAQIKTQDNVLKEWYYIDGNAIITYESDFEKGTWARIFNGEFTTIDTKDVTQGDQKDAASRRPFA